MMTGKKKAPTSVCRFLNAIYA